MCPVNLTYSIYIFPGWKIFQLRQVRARIPRYILETEEFILNISLNPEVPKQAEYAMSLPLCLHLNIYPWNKMRKLILGILLWILSLLDKRKKPLHIVYEKQLYVCAFAFTNLFKNTDTNKIRWKNCENMPHRHPIGKTTGHNRKFNKADCRQNQ